MSDFAIVIGVDVARRVMRVLPSEKELSLFEIIALSTSEVLDIIDVSEEPFEALDEVDALEEAVRR